MSDYTRLDGSGEPVFKEIMSEVVSKASSKYYEIGIGLGLDAEKIDAIKLDLSLGGQPDKFLMKILQEWRSAECSPYNWSTILKALASDSVKKKSLADHIYNKKMRLERGLSVIFETDSVTLVDGLDETETINSTTSHNYCSIQDAYALDGMMQDSVKDAIETRSESSGTASDETITFLCGCGECTIGEFLDGEVGCKRLGKNKDFPLLDTSSLSHEKQLQLVGKLQKDVFDIDEKFSSLVMEIASCFEEKKVNIEKLKLYLVNLQYLKARHGNQSNELLNPIQKNIREAATFSDIFMLLANFWSWFNFLLLEKIVQKIGSKDERDLLADYISSLTEFLQRYVYEMPLSLHTPKSMNKFTRFKAKLSEEMKHRKADELPLIQEKFANILGIESCSLMLTTVRGGCVELEFLVPENIQDMFPLSEEIRDEIYNVEWKILRLHCEGVTEQFRDDQENDNASTSLIKINNNDDTNEPANYCAISGPFLFTPNDVSSTTSLKAESDPGYSGSIQSDNTNEATNNCVITGTSPFTMNDIPSTTSLKNSKADSDSGYSGSMESDKGMSVTERTSQPQGMIKGIHIICQSCFEINPCDESIVSNVCTDPLHDGSPTIHATWDYEAQRSVQVRPLPQIVLSGGFARCNPYWCRGNNCTYAHSLIEQKAWNYEILMLKIRRNNRSPQFLRQHPPVWSSPFPICSQDVIYVTSQSLDPRHIIKFSLNRNENYSDYNKWKLSFENRLHRTDLTECAAKLESILTEYNYQDKFYILLCFEEMEHIKILTERCDGTYELELLGELPQGIHRLAYENPQSVGCLKGMDGNQLAYATQSSSGVFFVEDRKDVCKAHILSCNFNTHGKEMYVSFTADDSSKITKRLNQQNTCIAEVEFEVKHGFFDKLHKAVTNIPNYIIKKLMPKQEDFQAISYVEIEMDCLHECLNVSTGSQLLSLQAILGSSSRVPVLLSGPFGSGKTRVLARATYEIITDSMKSHRTVRIIICAHHSASTQTYITDYFCDTIGAVDNEWRRNVKLIRITRGTFQKDSTHNAYFRNLSQFQDDIEQGKYLREKHLIVITTYMTAVSLLSIIKPGEDGFFTHVMLDEAGQVREPEAIAPLCLARPDCKIVVAGDSKQVGPSLVVLGEEACNNDLGVSLLERLEKRYNEIGAKASDYVNVLTENYRNSAVVANFLGGLFYNTTIIPKSETQLHPKVQFPFVFYCCDVESVERVPLEPTLEVEADAVIDQMKTYFQSWPKCWGKQSTEDLCVIAPTRNQVNLIRKKLDGAGRQFRSVKVLPTYMIQGNEFRAIFLSTSEPLNREGSSNDPLKSLCHPAVFNTAVSRAKSLVIAVGNPLLLMKIETVMGSKQTFWKKYLQLCLQNETLFFKPQTVKLYIDIIHNCIKEDDSTVEEIGSSMIKSYAESSSQDKLAKPNPRLKVSFVKPDVSYAQATRISDAKFTDDLKSERSSQDEKEMYYYVSSDEEDTKHD